MATVGRPRKQDSERRDQPVRAMVTPEVKERIKIARGETPESEWVADAIVQRLDRDAPVKRRRK